MATGETWREVQVAMQVHREGHSVKDWQAAKPLPGHQIRWTVEAQFTTTRFACTAEKGSTCRLTCKEECGAEYWPCYSWDETTDSEREHEMVDGGRCGVAEWLDECGTAEESYDGPEQEISSGPIIVRWNGDDYVWRYPMDGAT